MKTVVMLGVVIGVLSISFTSPILSASLENEIVKTEKSATSTEDDQRTETTLKAFDAITSSVQINLNQQFFLIDVLPEVEELHEELGDEQEAITAGSKVLKILFRRIISPNAP